MNSRIKETSGRAVSRPMVKLREKQRLGFFENIFNLPDEGIFITDPLGRIIMANTALCEMTGYTQQELSDMTGVELIAGPPDIFSEELFAKLYQGEINSYETYYKRKDGSTFPVGLKINAVRDIPDLSIGIIVCIQDMTLMRRAEMQLKDALTETKNSLVFLQNTFRMCGDGLYVTDEAGYIVWVNQALCEIMGYTEQKLVAKHANDISPELSSEEPAANMIQEMFQKDCDKYFESLYQRKDGTIFPVELKVTNMLDAGGPSAAIIVSVRDIAERKNCEQQLKAARDELEQRVKDRTMRLEEANTALKVLLNNRDGELKSIEEKIVSNVHALINPYLEKLSQTKLNEQQKAYLYIATANLKDIISPFLHATKYLKLTPAEIKIANLITAGKNTKEISEVTHLSLRTIEGHRERIREKLGIRNKKANLRTYLLELK